VRRQSFWDRNFCCGAKDFMREECEGNLVEKVEKEKTLRKLGWNSGNNGNLSTKLQQDKKRLPEKGQLSRIS